jgi:hypothetical protein
VDFADKIDGAILGFFVNAKYIFANDSQENQLDRAQKIET